MKFHWFHLMPYPGLPDDFRQKYRCVWGDPPSALSGHMVTLERMPQVLELIQRFVETRAR